MQPTATEPQISEKVPNGELTAAGSQAAAHAVNLLFEDIDALATENALLTVNDSLRKRRQSVYMLCFTLEPQKLSLEYFS